MTGWTYAAATVACLYTAVGVWDMVPELPRWLRLICVGGWLFVALRCALEIA